MKLHASTIILAAAAMSQMGSTNCGVATRDPGFDLWCGDSLCAWRVERGEIKRIPTWNEGDSGVELVGPDVAIEQLSPVNSGDGTCLKFELVANVEDNVEAYLNVDVQGDLTLEMHQRIFGSKWQPLSYDFAVKAPYDGIRFELEKHGNGRAQFAQIQARTVGADECAGLEVLDPGPRDNGTSCGKPTDCASGLCTASPVYVPAQTLFDLVCVGCTPGQTSGCAAGEVCGLGDPALPIVAAPVQCVPQASRELGERCVGDGECASGICVLGNNSAGVCSACASDAACTGGLHCGPAWPGGFADDSGPYVCGAGSHLAPSGAPCGTDDDCASAQCGGAIRKECRDGRPCTDASDCPFAIDPGDEPLQNGACNTVGVQGGTCQ